MSNMDRRTFLSMTAAGLGASALPLGLVTGCASLPVRKDGPTLDQILLSGPRVMWIAAHPDDEILVGSILAKSSLVLGNPLYFLVLTHGEGGDCCRPEGCHPDVGTVRGQELKEVVALYHARLQHEKFFNAPLPVSSFPKRHELAKIWREHKDPTLVCARAIREFKPDLLFTFDPDFGATGHPEHQLASRFATAGVRMAADPNAKIDALAPHRVDHVFFGLNKHWLVRALGGGDDRPVTDIWDATVPCIKGKACYEIMSEYTRPHRTQANDMGAVRQVPYLMKKNYLYRADPFTEIKDPYEPV